ncbi:hypothetical protein KDL45_13095, partial [bacterium]|nr:hypothetical protein [bacterium]
MRQFYFSLMTVLIALLVGASIACSGSGGDDDDDDDSVTVGDDDDDDTDDDDDDDSELMCLLTQVTYDDCGGSDMACEKYTYNANGDA